jgi:hypothetical protein
MAHIYLMKIVASYDTEPAEHDRKSFERKNAESTDRRILFDRNLLVQNTSSFIGIVYEIKRAKS